MASRKFSTFLVDGQLFGVDVEAVQEVTRAQELTPVPLAHPAVSGLMNLRGQVVTVVDVRRRLGCAPRPDGAPAVNMVLRSAGSAGSTGGMVSLLVDTVEGFTDVTEEQFADRPDTVTGPARELVLGAYQLPDRLLLALDLDRAVDTRN